MVVFKKRFLFLVLLTVKCMVVKFVSGDSKSTTNYMVDVNHSSIMLERKLCLNVNQQFYRFI